MIASPEAPTQRLVAQAPVYANTQPAVPDRMTQPEKPSISPSYRITPKMTNLVTKLIVSSNSPTQQQERDAFTRMGVDYSEKTMRTLSQISDAVDAVYNDEIGIEDIFYKRGDALGEDQLMKYDSKFAQEAGEQGNSQIVRIRGFRSTGSDYVAVQRSDKGVKFDVRKDPFQGFQRGDIGVDIEFLSPDIETLHLMDVLTNLSQADEQISHKVQITWRQRLMQVIASFLPRKHASLSRVAVDSKPTGRVPLIDIPDMPTDIVDAGNTRVSKPTSLRDIANMQTAIRQSDDSGATQAHPITEQATIKHPAA